MYTQFRDDCAKHSAPPCPPSRAQLKGSINDCSCTVDTVDYFNNNKVFPRLRSLLLKDYFRFYRVNLHKQCPFWEDDSKCAMRFCSVSPCADQDIPRGLRELNEDRVEGEAVEHDEERPYEKVSGFGFWLGGRGLLLLDSVWLCVCCWLMCANWHVIRCSEKRPRQPKCEQTAL